ncbi:MAG: enoyl-CoA hydratase/isomerase family protein [Thermodesulfobacteriota bacterium]
MKYSTLLFDVKDGIAHLTLNRPEALNSINLELSKDLMQAVLECDEDPRIRAVVLSGNGRLFCAGGDLKTFTTQGERLPYYVKEVTTYLHGAVSRLTRMDPPVVAAVHGFAVGAGMSLALACDLVVAAETASFSVAYTRVGLTPDGSMSYFLPRLIGLKRALELTLTNRTLSAQEALDWGLVTRVVPDGKLLSEANALAIQLAAGPAKALGAAKRLIHRGSNETLETEMENETQTIAGIARTSDTHEAIRAFIEKRAPKFKGE